MSHKSDKQQLWVILLIVFIGFIGASVAYPIFPPLFLYNNSPMVPVGWNDNTKNILLGFALAAYPLGQFFGSPIIGSYSDCYGRKKILIWSLSLSAFGYLLSALSLTFNWLWVLLFSRFITGVMEGNFSVVRAIAADFQGVSKYKSLGMINGVAAIGYVIGPLIGGFFSDSKIFSWFSLAFPFYLAMIFSIIALVLTAFLLLSKSKIKQNSEINIWQQLNVFDRYKQLFKTNENLKSLLIISTVFTFAVDIFYEFGPVYLTGLWSMTPADIAIYNTGLSLTLSVGAGWLPYYLSLYYSTDRVIILGMLSTAVILGLMVLFPFKLFIWILFTVIGLSISLVTTNMVITVSNVADQYAQGEAMGAQLGLRTLGDAVICIVFGLVIMSSVMIPIVVSSLIAFLAAILYMKKYKQEKVVF